MSSFIVEEKTINKIVNFLVTCAYSKEEFKPCITNEINKFGLDLTYNSEDKNPDARHLGQRMFVLNQKAVNFRYKEKGNFELFKFDDSINEYNLMQILKSLQCFLYQCSEGEIMKEPLFKTLERITNIIKEHIINHLEDYKKAKWE